VPVKFVTVIDVQKGRHQKIHMRNTSVEVDDVTEPEDGDDLWYIKKQNDLYQTDQWFNFLLPGGTYVICLLCFSPASPHPSTLFFLSLFLFFSFFDGLICEGWWEKKE